MQEIIADLSAQALCCIAGKSTKRTIGNSYRYIEQYAKKMGLSAYAACLQVLEETEKVLDEILEAGEGRKAR